MTQKNPIHARRLTSLMRRHRLTDLQLAAASETSVTTVRNVRLGKFETVNNGTATSLARGVSKLVGEEVSGAWLRGEAVR